MFWYVIYTHKAAVAFHQIQFNNSRQYIKVWSATDLHQYFADAAQRHLSRKKCRISVCFSIFEVHLHHSHCSVFGKRTRRNYRYHTAKLHMLREYIRNNPLSQHITPWYEWRSWETPYSTYWWLLFTNGCAELPKDSPQQTSLGVSVAPQKDVNLVDRLIGKSWKDILPRLVSVSFCHSRVVSRHAYYGFRVCFVNATQLWRKSESPRWKRA